MAFSLVSSAFAASTNAVNVSTGSINTTGASLLVAWVGRFQSSGTLSDSKSNTWTPLTAYNITIEGEFYYVLSPTVGSGHTFSFNSAQVPNLEVMAFSSAGAVSFIAQTGTTSGSGTTLQPGSLTLTTDDLAVAGYTNGEVTTTITVNTSTGFNFSPGNSNGVPAGQAYYLAPGGTYNPTFTSSVANGNNVAAMCQFRDAGSGDTLMGQAIL